MLCREAQGDKESMLGGRRRKEEQEKQHFSEEQADLLATQLQPCTGDWDSKTQTDVSEELVTHLSL